MVTYFQVNQVTPSGNHPKKALAGVIEFHLEPKVESLLRCQDEIQNFFNFRQTKQENACRILG
jgi:hypothetical protein